ncbi:MAG: tetratricopeptide repeat protein [Gammaproteobacteria bacterium]|nr:tetratricopeptide repeat protein [Gammaproteobacteria bacterium]
MTPRPDGPQAILAAQFAKPLRAAPGGEGLTEEDVRVIRLFFHTCLSTHGGVEVEQDDDMIVAAFADPASAVSCARAIRDGLRTLRPGLHDSEEVKTGISPGSVDGASTPACISEAKSLWSLATPGDIIVSDAVRQALGHASAENFSRIPRPGKNSRTGTAYRLDSEANAGTTSGFFQELIRRRVFRSAGAYIVVAWVIVQVASIIFPEFDAPRWSMRALIILLIAGFPPAMLLAWTVDFTAGKFVRTPDSPYSMVRGNALRFGMVVGATVFACGMLWWAWTAYIEPTTQRMERRAMPENPVVAVVPPRKTAGAQDIDWLGEGVANLIRNQIAESSAVIVVSPTRWNTIVDGASDPGDYATRARNAGVDYIIGGSFLQTATGISLSPEIEDVKAGNTMSAATITGVDASEIIERTPELSLGIKRALNIPFKSNVEQLTADFAAQNMEAYEAYVAGLGFFMRFEYDRAEELFRAALDIAPDFYIARYRLAMVLESAGRADAAYAELEKIPDLAELPRRERLYVEGAKATFTSGRDSRRAIEVYSELVEAYPYDNEAGQHLAEAYWNDFQDEKAIEIFRNLAEIHSYDPSAWMALGERLLEIGRLEEAATAIRKYQELAPGDAYASVLLGNLAQLESRTEDSIEHYREALELRPKFDVATIGLARSHYLLGELQVAEGLWQSLVADEAVPPHLRIDAAFDLAGILRGQGQFEKSSGVLGSVEALIHGEELRVPMLLSTRGSNALAVGQLEQASQLIEQAVEASHTSLASATRYLFARGLLEYERRQVSQLRQTAEEIRAIDDEPGDDDRTEEKAALFLDSLAGLLDADAGSAYESLTRVVEMQGYDYAIYRVGLARAALELGEYEEAATHAASAMRLRDPGDLRLDLELDRSLAQLLYAEILAAWGRRSEASRQLHSFIGRWRHASDQSRYVQEARALLAELQ